VGLNSERYPGQPALDRDLSTGEFHLLRQLDARLSLQVLGRYTDTKLKNVQADSKDFSGTASLAWQMLQKLSLNCMFQHDHQLAKVSNVDYAENRIWLMLRYGTTVVNGVGPFGMYGSH
jgi:hypothetical protein